MNREGYLVTKDGDYVLGESGPIQLPTDFESLTVEESGEIYADGQYVDRLALVDFEDYDYVEAYGENLYKAVDGATQTEATAKMKMAFETKTFKPREFKVTKAAALDYEVGDTVRHIKFGVGIVKDIVDGGRDYEVTVDFDKVGIKKMFAGFAKLKKI